VNTSPFQNRSEKQKESEYYLWVWNLTNWKKKLDPANNNIGSMRCHITCVLIGASHKL